MRLQSVLPWLAFLLAGILVLARLGQLPLIEPDEGRNAAVAREMMESGAWLIPTYNGLDYLDKPAFYFKLVALSFSALGVSEAAARLPSALAAIAVLVLLYLFCRRAYGELTAGLTVLIVSATPLFLIFARFVIFDMLLALFVSLTVLLYFLGEELRGPDVLRQDRSSAWLRAAAAVSAALATLVKGPVGFLVPTLVLWVFYLPREGLAFTKRFFAPQNLLLFFGITIAWFLTVAIQRPDFVHYGLVEESLRRYSTGSFQRTAPFYYYVPVLAGTFFPWTMMLPEGIVAAWRQRARLVASDGLFIVWALAVVFFFSTSQSKLPGYILTAEIALAVLVARVFGAALANRGGLAARLVLRANLLLAGVSAAGAALFLLNVMDPGRLQSLLHIRSAEFDRLQPVLLPTAIALIVITLVAVLARVLRRPFLAFVAFLLFPLSFLTLSFDGFRDYAQASSSRPLAEKIRPLAVDANVACLRYFPTGLPFYLERSVFLVTPDGHEITSNYIVYRLEQEKEWPPMLVPWQERFAWIEQQQKVLLLGRRRFRAELDSLARARGGELMTLTPDWWGILLDDADRAVNRSDPAAAIPSLSEVPSSRKDGP